VRLSYSITSGALLVHAICNAVSHLLDYIGVANHLERLHDVGARLPGTRRTEPPAVPTGAVAVRADVVAALRRRTVS